MFPTGALPLPAWGSAVPPPAAGPGSVPLSRSSRPHGAVWSIWSCRGEGGGDLGSRGRSSEPERQFPARVTGHRVRRGAARGSGPSCGPECGARRARAGWCAGAPAGPIHEHTAAVGARCGLGKGGTRGFPVRAALGLPRSDVRTPPTSVPCRAEGRCSSPPPPQAFMAPAAGKFQGWICLTPISSRGIAFCLCQQHRQPPPAPAPPPRGSPPNSTDTRGSPCTCSPRSPPAGSLSVIAAVTPAPLAVTPLPPPHVRGTARCDSPQRPPETLGAVPQPDPAQPRAAAELPPYSAGTSPFRPAASPRASGTPPRPFPSLFPADPTARTPPPHPPAVPGDAP